MTYDDELAGGVAVDHDPQSSNGLNDPADAESVSAAGPSAPDGAGGAAKSTGGPGSSTPPNPPPQGTSTADSAAGNANGAAGSGAQTGSPGTGSTAGSGAGTDPAAGAAQPTAAADAAKSTPKLNTIANTVGAGVSKDLYREPVSGIPGLFKAQYKVGSDAAEKVAAKLGAKTSAKVLGRLIPGVGAIYSAHEAYKSFEDGDYIASTLNLLGVIPGPIGWLGMGAAAAWDMFETHDHGTYGMWDAPDGTNTYMLPASAKSVVGVKELDAKLRDAQQNVFSFQDGPTGTVWNSDPPAALALDGPEVHAAVTEWLGGISDVFSQIDQLMATSGEPYFEQYHRELAPHLKAMIALREHIKPLMDQLTAVSAGGKKCYEAVLGMNKAARQQLSTDGALTDPGAASGPMASVQAGTAMITAANDKIGKLFDQSAPPVFAASSAPATNTDTGKGDDKDAVKPVTALRPTDATPAPVAKKDPGTSNDDLAKMLSSLNNRGMGSPLGGTPMGSPFGGGTPMGGAPLATPQPAAQPVEPKKLLDDKPDHRRDDKSLSANHAVNPSAPAAAVTPAATPVTPAATLPGLGTAKPAVKPDNTVDFKGKKVQCPDAKRAKLAQLLAGADPNHPLSLANAATQAGLTPPVPGQDPGQQVAPADVKPMDVLVAGDKQYAVLGDGKFYDLQNFKTVDASELPHDLGSRAGYFRLGDPTAAGTATAVSAPTAGVPFTVPAATDTPTGPVNASLPPQVLPPVHPPTDPPAAPQSVASSGSPDTPKQGTGSGPGNAAATNTGTGTNVPSMTVTDLDPNAVR